MKTNVIIFGKNGQVASNLIRLFAEKNSKESNFNVHSYSSGEVDFVDLPALKSFLNNLAAKPDLIINAAAYTNVEKAEEERILADAINHQAVEIIAQYCAKNNIKLIHYSTDYVFDGYGSKPFLEDNTENLNPLNYYGLTKLSGEQKIIQSGCNYLILRTSWVYDFKGKNFVNTIIKLAKEKENISVVADQIGAPTYAKDIALVTIQIVKQLTNWQGDFPNGIYNLTNLGKTSRYDFALQIVQILKETGVDIKLKSCKKTKMMDYDTFPRPMNCMLECNKIQKVFNLDLRNWQDALSDFINSSLSKNDILQ
jgi:dTDP-4-dehydrorhamnose reductase